MTDPAPKPIADCPNPECKDSAPQCVPFSAGEGAKRYNVRCYDCGYGSPWAKTREEAIRLHNLLCRPQQSAEPVAWRAFRKDAAFKCYIYWEENPVDSLAEDEIYGPVQSLYLTASPGPSELVEHPNPETQAVAWKYINEKTGAWVILDFYPEMVEGEVYNGWTVPPIYKVEPILCGSPMESVPVAVLKELAQKWDNWADTHLDGAELEVAVKCHRDLLGVIKASGSK